MSEVILPRYAEGEVIVPRTETGALLTPYEAETGTPLPIVVQDIAGFSPRRLNDHHANFQKPIFLNGTPGTRSMCMTRLQHMPVVLHRRVHDRDRIVGSIVPDLPSDQYLQTVLGCSGYVPKWGLDLSGSEVEIVPLQEEQRQAIDIRIERKACRQAEIGQFLMSWAIYQDLSHVEPWLIDQLVSIKPRAARRNPELALEKQRLAMRLIGKGIEVAVEPVEPIFQQAKREDRLKRSAPVCAWLAVRNYVGQHASDYVRTLEYRLRFDYRSDKSLQTGVTEV